MKQRILKLVPLKIKTLLRFVKYLKGFISNYFYDAFRYVIYSSIIMDKDSDEKRLEAMIIKRYHVIEKGLSFPDTRLGFGKIAIIELLNFLEIYKKNNFNI